MRVAVLGSGSAGNSLIVVSGGRRLLIDAGFSCQRITQQLAGLGEDAKTLDALLLTHEHEDHVRGARVLQRRYGLPAYATAGTLKHVVLEAPEAGVHVVRSGEPFEVAGFRIECFSVPHDASEPVGFTVEDSAGRRLGVVADLGSRTQLAWGRLRDLDCLVLETNHDLHMLRSGPYPWALKQRVAGRHGHLSNDDAAAGLPELVSDRLRSVVLYHLSRTNNLPVLAAQAVGEMLDRCGSPAEIVLTRQDGPTGWIEIGDG
jgi:phosphoribosyl 1,2-cyclic phosphodiesterase